MSKTIVFDVDNCIACGLGCCIRPGVKKRFQALKKEGWTILLWSGGGEWWAHRNAQSKGLLRIVSGCYGKPDRPMTIESVLAVLGVVPDKTVDNDPTERIAGVEFELVDEWWGRHLPMELPKREEIGACYRSQSFEAGRHSSPGSRISQTKKASRRKRSGAGTGSDKT